MTRGRDVWWEDVVADRPGELEPHSVESEAPYLIAYTSDQSGRWEIYVQPYPGPGGRLMVSTSGGVNPVWSWDGRELFFRHGDEMWSAPVSMADGLTVGTPRLLFTRAYGRRAAPSYAYDPASDGFIMSPRDSVVPSEFRVVLNWRAGVAELLRGGRR